jgi:cytidylate kinase
VLLNIYYYDVLLNYYDVGVNTVKTTFDEERQIMKTIITIGRQYGSGGREIGQKLADHYGIKFYDKELLALVAKESGFCKEIIQREDERPTSSFLYNLVMDSYTFGHGAAAAFTDMPLSQKVFLAQFETIKSLAEKGPCVFIGRCADEALSDRDDVLNIFIHASEEFRINRVKSYPEYNEEAQKGKRITDFMARIDRQRQSYYNYYASGKWEHSSTYDMTIDSSLLGIDGTVHLLTQLIDVFEQERS